MQKCCTLLQPATSKAYRRWLWLPVFFLLIANISFAQNSKIDSLLNVISHSKEDTNKVNILNSLSLELANSSHYDSAMIYATEGKKMAEKINYKRGIAKAFNIIGLVYDFRGDYPEALKNYLYSLKIREDIGDQAGIIDCYNNIGIVYKNQGNYAEALKNLILALKVAQTQKPAGGNKNEMADIYINIGVVYVHQKNYSEALKNYNQALQISEQTGDKYNIASCYINIGNIYYLQNDYDSALTNYLQAIKIQEIMGNKGDIAVSLINIGSVLIKQKKYADAKKYLMDALQICRIIGAKDYLKECYNSLAELSEAMGDYKAANEYYKISWAIKDTLLNENNNKQIAEMQAKYETEKKEKEITVLSKDKEVQAVRIEKQKAAVKYLITGFMLVMIFAAVALRLYNQKRKAAFMQQVTQMEMKALRAQMNPHFIFHCINSAHRYMQEHDFQSASKFLLNFSRLIRITLENSMHPDISLTEELKALELYLNLESMRMEKKFTYEIKVAEDIDKENTLIPPLILQPFIENSILHGFAQKKSEGKVTLNISRQDSMLNCIIEDNGIGRQRSSEIKVKMAIDAVSEETETSQESLATKLTEQRISIINRIKKSRAHILVIDLFDEAKQPAGLRVELSLPLQLKYS